MITKANTQIKKTTPGNSGVLFILLERSGDRASLDDGEPSDVTPYIDAVEETLRSASFRGVHTVVISWDEIHVAGSLKDGLTIYTYLRKSRLIDNPRAESNAVAPFKGVSVASTVTRTLNYDGPPNPSDIEQVHRVEASGVIFSGLFIRYNERVDGVRKAHVHEAVANPTAIPMPLS